MIAFALQHRPAYCEHKELISHAPCQRPEAELFMILTQTSHTVGQGISHHSLYTVQEQSLYSGGTEAREARLPQLSTTRKETRAAKATVPVLVAQAVISKLLRALSLVAFQLERSAGCDTALIVAVVAAFVLTRQQQAPCKQYQEQVSG